MRAALFLIGLLLSGSYGQAQTNPAFVEAGINAIFVVGEVTTTAMYSFNYVAPTSAEVRWVLLVPPDALAITLDTTLLPLFLQYVTDPVIEPPFQAPGLVCTLSQRMAVGDGTVPRPDYYLPDQADLDVLETLDQAVAFLESDGNRLSPQQRTALSSYADQQYGFAALTLIPAQNIPEPDGFWTSIYVQVSPTIIVTYRGVEPLLPLAFQSVSTAAHLDNYDQAGILPSTAYIFADVPYAPTNAATFQPDLTRIEGAQNELANTMTLVDGNSIFFDELDPVYYALLLEGAAARDEPAFAAEYIGQAPTIERRGSTPAESRTLDAFNQQVDGLILSRWRTLLDESPAPTAVLFAPNPALEPMQLNLMSAADPAWFYGCTSRKLYDPELEARLPERRTYLEALHLSLAHPDGWSLSVLQENEVPMYILSPVQVTPALLALMRENGNSAPMLVVQGLEQDINQPGVWEQFLEGTPPQPNTRSACAAEAFYLPSPNAIPWADVGATAPLRSIQIALLSSAEDCAAHRALYQDMLRYAALYQYYLSPELRHTLFIGELYELVVVGYPEGWIETVDQERTRVIVPEGATYTESPAVRVYLDYRLEAEQAERQFGISIDEISNQAVVEFRTNERRGYLRRSPMGFGYIVEFSAPVNEFDTYADLLYLMALTARIAEPSEDD
ncbi:MAG: hypothetical protein IAE80_18295 [Anaerolinea sp.]|nr:hypothetical protein [Anaerolinea sp.]